MIGRESFTTPEWVNIQTAVLGTIEYVSMSTKNCYGDAKEKFFAKKEIAKFANEFDSLFVSNLADFSNYRSPLPPHADDDYKSIEAPVVQAIATSVESINNRSPETAETFKKLILHLAEEVGATYKTTSTPEKEAIENIKQALQAEPYKEKRWDPSEPLKNIKYRG